MTRSKSSEVKKSQSDKFKELASELGANENEKRWEEQLKKVAKPKTDKPGE